MKALSADELLIQLVDAERRVAQAKDETLQTLQRVTQAKDETLQTLQQTLQRVTQAKDENIQLTRQLAYQRELLQSGLREKGIVTTRGKCFFELRNASATLSFYLGLLLRRCSEVPARQEWL